MQDTFKIHHHHGFIKISLLILSGQEKIRGRVLLGAHVGNRSVLFKRLTVDNFTARIFSVNLDFKKN